ncbi:MAG: 50S ribosomal protein L24 [Planctomycetes bacterium]|nr:50S ribosomal protein L24 [Planctomycetota bacterium]
MYLKKNDLVVVISGAQKGKQGRVLRVIREKGKVVVQGINLRFKHLRRSQKNPQGGRLQKELPIPSCKVLLVDPKTNRPTRVGFKIVEGRKVRFAKKSGEPV